MIVSYDKSYRLTCKNNNMLQKIFGKKTTKKDNTNKETPAINWIPLTSLNQLSEIENESKKSLVGIFKHSTRCSISRGVLQQFEQAFPKEVSINMYYLDLLNHREISNQVGYKFQVIHQSPQILLIRNGETIAHASHYDIITQFDLQQFMK